MTLVPGGTLPDDPKTKRPTGEEREADLLSETELLALLEQARQNVKQLAKRALEGETITGDLLNMRLRSLR